MLLSAEKTLKNKMHQLPHVEPMPPHKPAASCLHAAKQPGFADTHSCKPDLTNTT